MFSVTCSCLCSASTAVGFGDLALAETGHLADQLPGVPLRLAFDLGRFVLDLLAVGRQPRGPAVSGRQDDRGARLDDREVLGRLQFVAQRVAHALNVFGVPPWPRWPPPEPAPPNPPPCPAPPPRPPPRCPPWWPSRRLSAFAARGWLVAEILVEGPRPDERRRRRRLCPEGCGRRKNHESDGCRRTSDAHGGIIDPSPKEFVGAAPAAASPP